MNFGILNRECLMQIKIKTLEKALGYKIKKNTFSVGFDTAEVCGVGLIVTTDKVAYIDWSVLVFDKSNIKNVYKELARETNDILSQKCNICIIEDTYLRMFGRFPQVNVLKKLTRFGGIVLANAINNDVEYEIVGATQARSKFKIKTTGYGKGNSKQGVIEWIKNTLGIDLTEDNACDAIVLALLGVCEGIDYTVVKKKKKRSKKQ